MCMKIKIEKRLVMLGVICLLLFTGLSGCTESPKNDNSQDQAKFVGKWISTDKENYPYLFGDEVTFYANGTIGSDSNLLDGSLYEVSGGKITVTFSDGHKGTPRTYSFSNDDTVLTLTDSTWEKTAVYTKVV